MPPSPNTPDDFEEDFTVTYAPEGGDELTLAIVKAVSWAKGVPIRDLEPLQSAIAIAELAELMSDSPNNTFLYRSSRSRPPSDDPTVSFSYEGYRITVAPEEIQIESHR